LVCVGGQAAYRSHVNEAKSLLTLRRRGIEDMYLTRCVGQGKRKAQRELNIEEPKTKQYLAFIAMADGMNGCIV